MGDQSTLLKDSLESSRAIQLRDCSVDLVVIGTKAQGEVHNLIRQIGLRQIPKRSRCGQ